VDRGQANVQFGSKCEELNLSKFGLPGLGERTSVRCAATSVMGHQRTSSAGTLLKSATRGSGLEGHDERAVRRRGLSEKLCYKIGAHITEWLTSPGLQPLK